MEQIQINHWAVIVCAVANLALGALWYSPLLFYKAWKNENKLSNEMLKKTNPAKVYGITCILSLVTSYNMAFFLGDANTDPAWGATAGFLTGFGFAAMLFTIVALFEMRSWKYTFINGGYITVYFTLIGWILGAWR
jgi:membrane protein YdbS with pleckstrin-like domain